MSRQIDNIGTRIVECVVSTAHAYYHVNGELHVGGEVISTSDFEWLIKPLLAKAWQEGKAPGSGNNPYSEYKP